MIKCVLAGSYLSRLRVLFWIAASNFVIPTVLNIIQLAFVYGDSNPLHSAYIYFVNIYISIIGALLATIWTSYTQPGEKTGNVPSRGAAIALTLRTPQFALASDISTENEVRTNALDKSRSMGTGMYSDVEMARRSLEGKKSIQSSDV